MNNKITFPKLATLIAERSGRSKRFSEDFLREFFALISETLELGEIVKIKGLGTFRLSRVEPRRSVDVTTGEPMEISGHTKVSFIPSKELAEAVNAPFEAFTAIEISDEADIDQLFSNEEIKIVNQEETSEDSDLEIEKKEFSERTTPSLPEVTSPIEQEEFENRAEEHYQDETILTEAPINEDDSNLAGTPITSEASGIAAVDQIIEEKESSGKKEMSAETDQNVEEEESVGDDQNYENEKSLEEELEEEISPKKNWIKGIMVALGAAVIALFATLIVWYVFATVDFKNIFNKSNNKVASTTEAGYVVGKKTEVPPTATPTPAIASDTISDSLQKNDLEEEVPTAPSDVVVYDTISTTRYLTTMAKTHYGNYNLWPYIYQENQSFLGHPDRIRPGTPVVIPKLSKYGIDPSNPEDIEKAKKLGIEIYARYGKKI